MILEFNFLKIFPSQNEISDVISDLNQIFNDSTHLIMGTEHGKI